ncbi:MAG: radical SAM protein [Nanoarchaeota archaeon]|nr:radical SAM protein [Nanoarchaeota archaeon]
MQVDKTLQRTKLIDTLTLCPCCHRVINAKIVEEDRKVFMVKEHCGVVLKVLQENDAEFYKRTMSFTLPNVYRGVRPGMGPLELMRRRNENAAQLYLYVTNRCNLNCPICFERGHGEKDLKLEEVAKIVGKYRANYYVISGGEPTLHPQILQIIKLLKEKGKYVFLITNGIKLCDEDFVRGLKEAGVDMVGLSFEGLNDEVYEKIRGRKLVKEKLAAVRNLRRFGIKCALGAVIDKDINIESVKEVMDFAIQNRGIVSMVWFGCMNFKDKTRTTKYDIWKFLEGEYDIPLEYVIEERRLRYLVNILAWKFFGERGLREFSVFNANSIYLKVKGERISTLFDLEKLKEMNEVLEKASGQRKGRALLTILLGLRKFLNRGVFKLLISLLLSGFLPTKASKFVNKSKIIRVRVSQLIEEYTADLLRTGSITHCEESLKAFQGDRFSIVTPS